MNGAQWLISVIIPLATTLVGGTLVLGLLKLPSDRKQMAAATRHEDASATDLLTGTALKMVQAAQERADQADLRSISAHKEATAARVEAEAARREATEASRMSVECAGEVMRMNGIIHIYEDFILAKGLPLPPIKDAPPA